MRGPMKTMVLVVVSPGGPVVLTRQLWFNAGTARRRQAVPHAPGLNKAP
jgi:hypothetical protein